MLNVALVPDYGLTPETIGWKSNIRVWFFLSSWLTIRQQREGKRRIMFGPCTNRHHVLVTGAQISLAVLRQISFLRFHYSSPRDDRISCGGF